eukprot:391013-Rhodomonas_salina.1
MWCTPDIGCGSVCACVIRVWWCTVDIMVGCGFVCVACRRLAALCMGPRRAAGCLAGLRPPSLPCLQAYFIIDCRQHGRLTS